MPPNENVKLPVAIKVLNEGSSVSESRELLDEARIMASVVHPYCLRVVAVCMTAQLMLVVPLMPLGCLLDYVRKNRANIDSKRMLNWATQIARVSWPALYIIILSTTVVCIFRNIITIYCWKVGEK